MNRETPMKSPGQKRNYRANIYAAERFSSEMENKSDMGAPEAMHMQQRMHISIIMPKME